MLHALRCLLWHVRVFALTALTGPDIEACGMLLAACGMWHAGRGMWRVARCVLGRRAPDGAACALR